MSERDELARTIEDVDIANEWDPSPGMYLKYGDAILAAGYRKPRTITTLGTLPNNEGTVIRTAHGKTMEYRAHYWMTPDSRTQWTPIIDWLPATVLWEPR